MAIVKLTPIILPAGVNVDSFDGCGGDIRTFYAHLTPPAEVTPEDIAKTLKGWFGEVPPPDGKFFRTGEIMVYGSNTPELFAAIWASREAFKQKLTKDDTQESIIEKLGIEPRQEGDVYFKPEAGIGRLLYSIDWTFQLLDGNRIVIPQEYVAFMQYFDGGGLHFTGSSVESSALRVVDREPLFRIFKQHTGLEYLAEG